MKEEPQKSWGELAFLFGIALAILFSFFPTEINVVAPGIILAVLGLIVGFLNVSNEETHSFLVASIALLLVGSAGLDFLPYVGSWLGHIFLNISQFVAPAAMIVALKAVIDMAKK